MSSASDAARADDDDLEAITAMITAMVELKKEKRRLSDLRAGLLPQAPKRRSLDEILAETAIVRAEADRLELEQRERLEGPGSVES